MLVGELEELLESSRSGMTQAEQQIVRSLRQAMEHRTYAIIAQSLGQKQYVDMMAERASLVRLEFVQEATPLVQARNSLVFEQLRSGVLALGGRTELVVGSASRISSYKLESQPGSRIQMDDQEEELSRIVAARQLIRKKQEQKSERHRRIDQVLARQAQLQVQAEEQRKRESQNYLRTRNQQSLEKYRQVKSKYEQDQQLRKSRLDTIKEFQDGLFHISRQKGFSSIDKKRQEEMETSRTQAIIQRRSHLQVDHRQVDDHNRRYMDQRRSLEQQRATKMSKRKSQDIRAIKLIKPFFQSQVCEDPLSEVKQRVSKMRQFKEYVRAYKKPHVDPNKRREVIDKIINEDANRYKSHGIVKQEINGAIVERELPKINLRALGNQYMQIAKKMKSSKTSMEQRQIEPKHESTSRSSLFNYLDDLKKQERKRLSRSEEIQRGNLSFQEKVSRIQISIGCLEREIQKHQTLIRNSSGLTSDRIGELHDAIGQKSAEIIQLNLALAKVIGDGR